MKPTTESPRTSGHLPAWILEGVAFEAELADGRPRADERAHLETCERCQGVVRKLRAARRQFLEEEPEEAFFARVARTRTDRERLARPAVPAPSRSRTRPWLAAASLAAAAATWLVFFLPTETPTNEAVAPKVRMRGAPAPSLHLFVSRAGKMAAEMETAQALRAGDLIRFGVTLRRSGHVYVVNLDGKGRFSLYFPQPGAAQGRAYAPSEKIQVLPGSIELDDYLGREAIYLLLSDKPLEVDALKRAFVHQRGARSFPAPDQIDLPARIVRKVIIKEPAS